MRYVLRSIVKFIQIRLNKSYSDIFIKKLLETLTSIYFFFMPKFTILQQSKLNALHHILRFSEFRIENLPILEKLELVITAMPKQHEIAVR